MNDILCQLNSLFGKEAVRLSPTDVFTPQWVVKDMVNLLPAEVFNPNTTFLDPAVKSGRFLIELYDRLMKSPSLQSAFPDETERSTHILTNQLYGFATSSKTALLARTSLYGEPFTQGNIRYIKDYISKVKDTVLFKQLVTKEFGTDMKFDVVIGNPPYQDTSNKAIYHFFLETAMLLHPKYISMITKDNWFNQYQFRKFRTSITDNNYTISKVIDYPIVGEVFEGVQVSAAIVLMTKDEISKTLTEFISIVNGQIVEDFEQDFNLSGVIVPKCIDANIISKIHGDPYNDFCNIANMWQKYNSKYESRLARDDEFCIKYFLNKFPHELYFKKDVISNKDTVADKYKVLCGLVINSAKKGKAVNIITNIKLGRPLELFYDTWVTVGYSSDPIVTSCIYKYIKTRFVRCLVSMTIVERGNVSTDTFAFVPNQNFTANSDIDWSKSIADIDKQLYIKYNLTKEEIDYIEDTIKPMV